MTQPENFREKLMETISENPGLHFRELQRRTGSAVGKQDHSLCAGGSELFLAAC